MNKLSRYKLVHVTPNHFVLHDGKAHFHIAKKGLDAGMIEQIQSLADGGEAIENPVNKALKEAFSSADPFMEKNHDHATVKKDDHKDPYLPGKEEFMKSFRGDGYAHGGEIDHNISPDMEKHTAILNTLKEDEALRKFVLQHFAGESGNPADQEVKQTLFPGEDYSQNPVPTEPAPVTASPVQEPNFSPVDINAATQMQQQQIDQILQSKAAEDQTINNIKNQNDQLLTDNAMKADSSTVPMSSANQPAPIQTVPKEQQVSISSAVSQPGKIDLVGPFEQNVNKLTGAMEKNAEIQAKGLQQNAENIQSYLDAQQQRQKEFNIEQQKIEKENNQIYEQIRDNKIDANRLWHDSSTGAKIAASLGLIFGGIGAGMTGQPNAAASYLEKAIANDIDAQKTDSTNRMNLYKIGLEKYRDERSAEQYATLQAQSMLAGQIQQTAARIGSAQAKNLADQAVAELNLKYGPMRQELALKQLALNYSQPATGQTGINTDKMTKFINAGLYDDATKKELVKEQADYIKAKNLLDETERVFKEGYANATYTSRIPGASYFPSYREKTKLYESAVKSYLDKMTKDLTGRVTPQSMENLHSSMPLPDDSPETVKRKMNDMKDIIKSVYAFPTLQNKGLLNPNDPVLQSTGNVESKFTQGKPVLK